MSDTKRYEGHTPGPWNYDGQGTVYGPQHDHAQAVELGVAMQFEPIVAFIRGHHGSAEAKGNGLLIADAPLLLKQRDALLASLKKVIEDYDISRWADDMEFGWVDEARNAIALAERGERS